MSEENVEYLGNERGAASLRIELRRGVISVYHGSQTEVLLGRKLNTKPGDWDRMIKQLQALGIEWLREEL